MRGALGLLVGFRMIGVVGRRKVLGGDLRSLVAGW